MRVNPAVRALRNSVLKGAAGQRPAQALTRGVEVAGQVGASASEFLRVRRDPSEVAVRRRRAAVRRANIWGAGVVVGVAAGAAVTVGAVSAGLTASSVFSAILVLALTIWCLLGLARAVAELRRRSRAVAALPPPQPTRRPVAAAIRPEIARLDLFSDGLRQLVQMLPADVSGATQLRREIISAADAAEAQLRRQAQEFTGLLRTSAGAPEAARPALVASAEALSTRVVAGVQEYGRLVTAATDTVVASADLTGAATALDGPTERLQALAMGMREIAVHTRPDGPALSA